MTTIDFNNVLVDYDDEPINDGDSKKNEKLTLGAACINALNGRYNEEINGEEKLARHRICVKIKKGMKAGTPINLKVDALNRIKVVLGKSGYPPMITGQIFDLIDPDEEEVKEEPK